MSDLALPLLSSIQIASPCHAKWEEMAGDERTRHCAQCDLDVHNISAMTSPEAEAFLRVRIGDARVCARMYRRADGTILTQDCPVGLALWRKRARFAAGRVAAAVLFLATGGFMASAKQREANMERLRTFEPFRSVCAWMNPTAAVAPPLPRVFTGGSFVAGMVAAAPPRPPAGPTRADGSPYVAKGASKPARVEEDDVVDLARLRRE